MARTVIKAGALYLSYATLTIVGAADGRRVFAPPQHSLIKTPHFVKTSPRSSSPNYGDSTRTKNRVEPGTTIEPPTRSCSYSCIPDLRFATHDARCAEPDNPNSISAASRTAFDVHTPDSSRSHVKVVDDHCAPLEDEENEEAARPVATMD